MHMKKWIAVLTLAAMLLALACPALAEEAAKEPWEIPVTEEELLGVWKADGNEDLEILIVPGSYAPVPERSKTPQLYGEGAWQEGDGMQVTYLMLLNKRGTEEGGGLLNALLGSTLAGAVKAIGALGNNDSNLEDVDAWDYTHASIGVEWITEEGDDYYNVTSDASGSFYAFHDEDMSVTLYWMDNYDPHALAQMLRRAVPPLPNPQTLRRARNCPRARVPPVQTPPLCPLHRSRSPRRCLYPGSPILQLATAPQAPLPTSTAKLRSPGSPPSPRPARPARRECRPRSSRRGAEPGTRRSPPSSAPLSGSASEESGPSP